MSVATKLAPLRLFDHDAVPVRLGDLWAERPIVLLFVRHFGCIFSREQVNEFKKHLPQLRAEGVEMVVVGSGRDAFARAFREELSLDVLVLVDPELVAYRAAGLRRGLRGSLSPRLVPNVVRALRKGYRPRGLQGDLWQQGGVFVIAPGDRVLCSHVSKVGGDHPDPARVLGVLGATLASEHRLHFEPQAAE
jgi:peroxiredoxin